MKKAKHFLNTREHAERKTLQVSKRDVEEHRSETEQILEELKGDGVNTEFPETRGDCPTVRPCPFVSCRYHLYLEVTSHGSIKFNFHGREPWEMGESCALDIADENYDGLPLSQIGHHLGLTRERIRQIEVNAFEKIKEKTDDETLKQLLQKDREPETTNPCDHLN